MAVEPALLRLTPEIRASLGLTAERELPKELKKLGGDAAEGMCYIDNKGENHCGHYALAAIGTLVFATVHNVPLEQVVVKVESVIENIRSHAMTMRDRTREQGRPDLADRYNKYLKNPPHILESFEASWYLRQCDINVVVVTRQKFRSKKKTKNATYVSEAVLYNPKNTHWVLLLHIDSCHWTNIVERVAPPSNYSLFFTKEQVQPFLDKDFDFSRPWTVEEFPVETGDFIDLAGRAIPNRGGRTTRTSRATEQFTELPPKTRRRIDTKQESN